MKVVTKTSLDTFDALFQRANDARGDKVTIKTQDLFNLLVDHSLVIAKLEDVGYTVVDATDQAAVPVRVRRRSRKG